MLNFKQSAPYVRSNMNIPKSAIIILAFIVSLLSGGIASGVRAAMNPCIECHQDIYLKSISYKYKHSVVSEQCSLCHIYPEEQEEIIDQIKFQSLQGEWLIYLDQLSENQDYQAEVTVTDSSGISSTPGKIDIVPSALWDTDGQRPSLRLSNLSGVMVKEIRKLGYVSAVISWDTDAFSTSEVEYRMAGQRADTLKTEGLFTRAHTITMDGLKHRSRYYFMAVSRDLNGHIFKSDEYSFDTSDEITGTAGPEEKDSVLPAVEHLQVFKYSGNKGMYLKVVANKLCKISVNIKTGRKKDKKHGPGLLPDRYSKIDVCLKCHPHDSSHPVGVRAVSPKIRTPDGLPTIENGIITCVTCHKPHGGELVHFNRFDYRKDLCMRCHLQKYST